MEKLVPVSLSNRHIHVSKEHLEILFGKGHELTKMKDLSQPGQFACDEKVDVVGPKSTLKGVRILGPVRPETQLEISMFDARTMGVEAMVRPSGKIQGTPGCTIIGPKGQVELKEGVIVAARHIHFHTSDGEKFGLKDRDIVKVRVGDERAVVFDNVMCRVHPDFALDMHIDIEEGNAAGIQNGTMGEIIR
ncbi:MAG TPA: phosphate propanoyltransferase [Clostridia bacterium]|nr:phosphate propanoyltransferase [Clostridia bacterium]